MYCPKCKKEYNEGIKRCDDCNVDLVTKLNEEKDEYDQEDFDDIFEDDIEEEDFEEEQTFLFYKNPRVIARVILSVWFVGALLFAISQYLANWYK
ncbi:hypothetical protein [Anaerosacchariphilus polymeriproducens]|uniref:Uncharacterized protein n=1 Tax=Anaerosacchariphilus polymeriproducens TaxID=1812858 RepID=A0A371AZY7_9FIRM|nr:hypothetical protein [Anaerosacchariphilus polymeriproducens]RDU25116.1 hypothetical protein DWV06_01055 [Anaerosacchariphilus polymeriproducens]